MALNPDDLAEYGVESDEDIVRILNERFQRQQYFVYIGDDLVTVNPWKTYKSGAEVKSLWDKEIEDFFQLYKGSDRYQALPPNPCSVAEKAVRSSSDCVIVPLGESGSGKSRNIQVILHYLSLRSQEKKLSKDTILSISEVLNLFCTARTLICKNSTRCLTVYEAFFDLKEQSLLGVNIKINLLEKSRVVNQIKGEGNFCIFHCLLNGLNFDQLKEHYLNNNHRYVPLLPKAFCEDKSVSQYLKCLEGIGLHEKEIEDVLHLVTAIVLLGDLEFGESSKRDVLAFRNGEVLEKAATLLGIPCSTLAELIITKTKKVKGQKVNISASCSRAITECDRLAAICYETLVMWIEGRINFICNTANSRLQSDYTLTLLDVFGWENYSVCSFQQLCINSVNEALQSTYNAVTFKTYQSELEDEGIYVRESCERFDQPGAVPFLFKPKGLLDGLHGNSDSDSRTSDEGLLKKLDTSFKKEPRYIKNNSQEFSGFLIEHFIGEVSYDISGFVNQSKNWVNNDVLACLKGSKNKVVSAMIQERINLENTSSEKALSLPSSSKKSSFNSVVEKDWLKTNVFMANYKKEKKKYTTNKNSNPAMITMTLTSVLDRISSSKIYFIRCINSNLGMLPDAFDQERVLRQIQWSNIYSAVKTRLACLKFCFSLREFFARYRLLFFPLSRSVSPTSELCSSVLSKRCDDLQYRVGKTKVFMSRNLVRHLDDKLEKTLLQITLIQKTFRGFLGRKQYQAMIALKKKYDEQRSLFCFKISASIAKFRDHLELQISEDRRRLKQNKLMDEQAKPDANQNNNDNNQPVTSPGSQGRRTSYAWGEEVITDRTSESSTWCKIICFQRTKQLAMFDVKEPQVVIDGTNHIFTTDRIGFNSFPTPSQDKQMKKIKACIGRGVQLYLSEEGSLIALRLCKNPIFVKGYFCEDKLLESLGELTKNEESKVFMYRDFIEKINYECHPARLAIDSEEKCLAMCVVQLCFVKNSESDEGAPCWTEVILTQAEKYVKSAISLSMERRREMQEKYHFQQPPALRMDSKMESTSAKILKLIRPSRYIETVKFKRKAWARKRVVSNPFLYGEGSFSEEEKSERSASVCSPDSSLSGLSGSIEEASPEELYENVQDKWNNFFGTQNDSDTLKQRKDSHGEPQYEAMVPAIENTRDKLGNVSATQLNRDYSDGVKQAEDRAENLISEDNIYENYSKKEIKTKVNNNESQDNLGPVDSMMQLKENVIFDSAEHENNETVYENYRTKEIQSVQMKKEQEIDTEDLYMNFCSEFLTKQRNEEANTAEKMSHSSDHVFAQGVMRNGTYDKTEKKIAENPPITPLAELSMMRGAVNSKPVRTDSSTDLNPQLPQSDVKEDSSPFFNIFDATQKPSSNYFSGFYEDNIHHFPSPDYNDNIPGPNYNDDIPSPDYNVEIPTPDYADSDVVYTNMIQMQQNAVTHQAMRSSYKMYGRQEFVNYSSLCSQYVEQRKY